MTGPGSTPGGSKFVEQGFEAVTLREGPSLAVKLNEAAAVVVASAVGMGDALLIGHGLDVDRAPGVAEPVFLLLVTLLQISHI